MASSTSPPMRSPPQAFVEALNYGQQPSTVKFLCGRIIKGRSNDDFAQLTAEAGRDLVFLMGSDGLSSLIGKSGYDMLSSIGYESEYIAEKVAAGYKFKLVVFSVTESTFPAKRASWDGALEVVMARYPEVAAQIAAVADKLKMVPLAEMEECYCKTMSMASIDTHGVEHPLFMTAHRLAATPASTAEDMKLARVRAFLYHTCQMRALYSGDGYTHMETGERGMEEWIAPNMSLEELGGHAVVDISVQLPLLKSERIHGATAHTRVTRG